MSKKDLDVLRRKIDKIDKGILNLIQERANIMMKRVDDRKDSQDTKLAFGWLFWPSYLIIDDNSSESQELSKLKGEYNAINRVIDEKNCKEEVKNEKTK